MLPIGFANALALGFLGLIPIIIGLHMLRSRRPPRIVSSTMLWRQVSQVRVGQLALRPPVVSLPLLLQILAVLLLAAALAAPGLIASGQPRHVLLVLDGTTSMLATDTNSGASRFEVARARAAQFLRELPAADRVSVALLTSRVQFIGDPDSRNRTIQALADVTAGGSGALLHNALDVFEAETRGKEVPEVILLTDGGLDTTGLKPFPGALRVSRVGQDGQNQGITQLSVRPAPNAPNTYEAFARVTNYDDQAIELPIRSSADGGVVFDRRTVRVPARGQVEMVLKVPTGARLIEVRADAKDVLPVDNYAAALVSRSDTTKVTLVSENPAFLERALQSNPSIQVKTVAPGDYRATPDSQVTVFDGFVPDQLPATDLLFVNPRFGPNPGVSGPVQGPSDDIKAPVPVRWDRSHPLLAGVDVGSMTFGRARLLDLPDWATPIMEAPDGPLVYEGDWEGRSVVVLAFDPMSSDLPLKISYPVLLANTMSWLSSGGVPQALMAGAEMTLNPVPGARELAIRKPDGSVVSLAASGNRVAFTQTEQPGRYVVTNRLGNRDLARQTFVVNAGSDTESDIRPRDIQLPPADASRLPAPESTYRLVTQENLWWWLVGAVLAVLMVEWLASRRWA